MKIDVTFADGATLEYDVVAVSITLDLPGPVQISVEDNTLRLFDESVPRKMSKMTKT